MLSSIELVLALYAGLLFVASGALVLFVDPRQEERIRRTKEMKGGRSFGFGPTLAPDVPLGTVLRYVSALFFALPAVLVVGVDVSGTGPPYVLLMLGVALLCPSKEGYLRCWLWLACRIRPLRRRVLSGVRRLTTDSDFAQPTDLERVLLEHFARDTDPEWIPIWERYLLWHGRDPERRGPGIGPHYLRAKVGMHFHGVPADRVSNGPGARTQAEWRRLALTSLFLQGEEVLRRWARGEEGVGDGDTVRLPDSRFQDVVSRDDLLPFLSSQFSDTRALALELIPYLEAGAPEPTDENDAARAAR